MKIFLIIIIFILSCLNAFSEELEVPFEIEVEQSPEYIFYLPKNPTKAALLSAFIPGAGQIYNERYLKAGAVIGIQAALVGVAVHSDRKMNDYKARRNDLEKDTPEWRHNEVLYREHYERRQSFIFWVATSVFLSAMEAYVDAHLINFNDRKKQIRLMFEDQKLQLSITF